MKNLYIRDLVVGDDRPVAGTFALTQISVRSGKTGKRYVALTLTDKTGAVEARMWDGFDEAVRLCHAPCYVDVSGRVESYQGKLQLVLTSLAPAASPVERADFVPSTEEDIDAMWSALRAEVDHFRNVHLRLLLNNFLDDARVGPLYKTWPAAKKLHHARLGGLLEHVHGLLRLARAVVVLPPYAELVDPELLYSGIILHDLGKLKELTDEPGFDYTLRGQLVGHISILQGMLHRRVMALNASLRREADAAGSTPELFPDGLLWMLEHLLLSHHSKLEFGSPKLPMTPEALLLSALDDMEAKFDTVRTELKRACEAGAAPDAVTDWVRSMERPLFDSRRYLAAFSSGTPPAAAGNATHGIPSAVDPETPQRPEPATAAGENAEMQSQLSLQGSFSG